MAGCAFFDESPSQEARSHTTTFNTLPIELNKAIAHYLETDRDVCSYRLVCRATNDAIDGDRYSFWRTRFRETYAYDKSVPNGLLKKEYQRRQRCLRIGASIRFYNGHSKNERKVLRVLRDLIVQSFQSVHGFDGIGRPLCPNQVQLINFIQNSMNFLSIKRLRPGKDEQLTPALAAIQIMCTHFLFHLQGKHDIYAADVSQKAVYQSSQVTPIYLGFNKSTVNMEWVLHCLAFFRNHMVNPELGEMHTSIEDLCYKQRVSAWRKPLESGCYPLSKYWKGTYAYLDLHELEAIRESSEDQVFMDKNIDQGAIQTVELEFLTSNEKSPWPKVFEKHLNSLREIRGAKTRAQHRTKPVEGDPVSIRLNGEGDDNEEHFFAAGWLNPLPAQPADLEIPGWQRITFMKYFCDADGHMDPNHLWAYEGVVIPGGRLIVGRWWWASDDQEAFENSGPFILWAVDPEAPEEVDLTSDDE
ncbi:hypothetical protein P154DRAFT_618273 [Amniculicola lignicola CBS 123094]|uniref:F-box domain-containing protein n=1 Tax=Amniculicola lignicola CBS 123094 TaxID=1392246 RepID=A0A6A5WUZ6_9PLEO|nr:hypothetical protein P154DRAFT_618273 [Amniculicola lignicola CBS 123094]